MSGNKHVRNPDPNDADLTGNPGIGTSLGTTGEDDDLDGETTYEGDVLSDAAPEGGVDPDQRGRTTSKASAGPRGKLSAGLAALARA